MFYYDKISRVCQRQYFICDTTLSFSLQGNLFGKMERKYSSRGLWHFGISARRYAQYLIRYRYLPSSRELSAECTAVHSFLDECIHVWMAALVQFMETSVALRHQAAEVLKLLVFLYATLVVYAAECEHSAGFCGVKAAVQLIDVNLLATAITNTALFTR